MFNLLPGAGLGFTGSKLIAFGLGSEPTSEIITPPVIIDPGGGGGGGGSGVVEISYSGSKDFENRLADANERIKMICQDDEEVLVIITTFMEMIRRCHH